MTGRLRTRARRPPGAVRSGLGAVLTSRQLLLDRESRSIDLFTKAIDHLGADPAGRGLRVGTAAALDLRYRGYVHALLTSFVGTRAPWRGESTPRRAGGPANDVAAAIAALGRGG